MPTDRAAGRRRALIVVVLSLSAAGALFGLTRLRFHDDTEVLFASSDPQHQLLQMLAEDFGLEEDNYFIVVNGGDLFTPSGVPAIRQIVHRVRQLDDVVGVDSVVDVPLYDEGFLAVTLLPDEAASGEDYERARRNAMAHPMIPSQVLSLDSRTALLIVCFSPRPDSVARIERTVEQLRNIAREATAGSDLTARITGIPPIRAKIMRTVLRDDILYSALSALAITALAALLFRRAKVLLVLFLVPSLTVLWALGILALSGVSLNVLTVALPALLLTVGMLGAAYLLAETRQGSAADEGEQSQAPAPTRRAVKAACLVAVTLAVGFATLTLVDAEAIRVYGLFAAIGALLSGAALAAVSGLLPREPLVGPPPDLPQGGASMRGLARPRLVAVLSVGVMIAAVIATARLRPRYLLTDTLPKTSEEYQALKHIEESFNGADSVYALLEWPETERFGSRNVLLALRATQQTLEDHPLTHGTLSIIDYLRCLPKSTGGLLGRARWLRLAMTEAKYVVRRFVRLDRRRALVRARINPTEATGHSHLFDELQERLAGVEKDHPGLHIRLTGVPVMNDRVLTRLAGDLRLCLLSVGVLLILVGTLAFRSLTLGLIGTFCSLFAPVVTAASLVWMGRPLDFVGILLCVSAWAIGTTHVLYVLCHYRMETGAGNNRTTAVRRTINTLAPMAMAATALLVAGSLCLLPSELPALRLFGVLSVVALLSGLVGGVGILPSLLLCCRGSRS